jgi:hypothetical protein
MKGLLILLAITSITGKAYAQAAIAGSVEDPSRAPRAGVTVEASSARSTQR